MNRKNKTMKVKSATLITAAIVASNGTLVFANNSDIKKDETVYSILDENGNIKENIVSTWIKSNSKLGEIKDISDLTNIKNLKGDEEPTINGNDVTWNIDGDDLYYSGNSTKSIPINIGIKYELNGKKVEPSEIINKSGKVKITISLKNREPRSIDINGENRTVYIPFLSAVEVIMPRDNFKDIDVSSGTVLDEGKNCSITFISAPGLKESLDLDQDLSTVIGLEDELVIEANATNFTMPSIMAVVSPNALDMNELENLDENSTISDLRSSLGDLQKGGESLLDGAKQLSKGANELNEKYALFNNGVKTLDSGISDLNKGVGELSSSTPALSQGAGTLHSGLYELKTAQGLFTQGVNVLDSGAAQLDSGISSLVSASPQLTNGANSLNSGVNEYVGGVSKLAGSYKGIDDGISSAYEGASSLVNGLGNGVGKLNQLSSSDISWAISILQNSSDPNVQKVAQMLVNNGVIDQFNALKTGLNEAYDGAKELQSGLKNLKSGSDTFNTNLKYISSKGNELTNGSSQLLSGINQLALGGEQLKEGSSALKLGTSELALNASKLNTATGTIYSGSGDLYDGTIKLNLGVNQLNLGSKTLKNGTAELSENSSKILSATEQLSSGASNLYNGTNKLKTDGLDKLYELGDEKLSKIDGVLQAKDEIINISKEYDNYGGKSEDMQSNVKFVMKVESSADENSDDKTKKEDNTSHQNEKGGILKWMKGLFK